MASISAAAFEVAGQAVPTIIEVKDKLGRSYTLFLENDWEGFAGYRVSRGVGSVWLPRKFAFALYLAHLRDQEKKHGKHQR